MAAIAAGVDWLRRDPPDVVVILAGDMPYAAAAACRLVDTLTGGATAARDRPQVAVARDEQGRRNILLSAWRWTMLRGALPEVTHNQPARALLSGVDPSKIADVLVPDRELFDIDEPADLSTDLPPPPTPG